MEEKTGSTTINRQRFGHLVWFALWMLVANIATAQIPTAGLVGYWPFNGNANDMSGNGNHGILECESNNPQLTTDRFGNANSAYQFGGYYNKNWVRVPNNSTMLLTDQMTISLWFQQCEFAGMDGWGSFSTTEANFSVLTKAGDGIAAYPGIFIGSGINSQTGKLSVSSANTNGHPSSDMNYEIRTEYNCFDTCEWVHFVSIVDDTIAKIYLNGVLYIDTIINHADYTQANLHDLFIGRMGCEGFIWYPFNGKIDDVAFYNRALSENEVAQLFGHFYDEHAFDNIITIDSLVVTNACNGNDGMVQIFPDTLNAPYQYALDYASNFQSSNIIQNISPGTHRIYIKSACGLKDTLIDFTCCQNPPVILHSPDTTIQFGDSATLWASGADVLYWTDASGNILASDPTLTVSPTTSTLYYITGQNMGADLSGNLVVNGDFEQGNVGFYTEYSYVTGYESMFYGSYSVTTDGLLIWGNDHLYGFGGTGQFMVVDGSETPNSIVWQLTVPVTPNTYYAFSAQVASTLASNDEDSYAFLQFSVNGTQLGPIFHSPSVLNIWQPYYEVWYSGSNTSATLTILNQNTDWAGNDFGLDDIVFAPVSTCTAYDSVYVHLSEFPDNVDSADCTFLPEGTEWSISQPIISDIGNAVIVSTPMVGDVDDDGQQEIVIPSATSSLASQLNIYNSDGTLKSQFNIAGTYIWNSIGLAKVRWDNSSYKTIIVVFGANNYLYAYDATGLQLWQSDQPFSSHDGESCKMPAISFADFNHDGWTEVFIGSEIFDAATGVLLCKTNGNKGGAYRTWSWANTPYQTMAADLCGDSRLELAVGNAVYDIDIQSRTNFSANSTSVARQVPTSAMNMEDGSQIPFTDGNTFLADINLDGSLDVIVMNVDGNNRIVYIYVWDVATNSIICSKKIPNARKFGTPQIGDLDNDTYPEICFITGTYSDHGTGNNDNIHALKYNPSNSNGSMDLFWSIPHEDNSGSTGLTMFDFNQDGYVELVYRDVNNLRIINGSLYNHQTGQPVTQPYDLAYISCHSATGIEYPVIADVDLDGEVEIIVGGETFSTDYGHLYIFKSGGIPWAPARPVWNQYMYNVTNVNKNLTIPQYLFNNATPFTDPQGVVRRPYNNFLQQATTIDQYGRPFYAVPDIAMDPSASSQMLGDSLVLTFSYCNLGDNMLSAPYPVTFFVNTFGGDTLCTVMMTNDLFVDSCFQYEIHFSVNDLSNIQNINSVIVAVNCAGNGIAQNGNLQPECDTTNNLTTIIFHPNIGLPDNVDSADCTVSSTGHDWGIGLDWSAEEMVSPLVIPLVGDIDGDEVPEIVCLAPNDNYNYYGSTQVMIFNTLTHQLIHTINLPERVSTNDAAPYGIVKLPNGHVILVVALINQTLHAYDLTAMGTSPLWSANTDSYGPNVSFTDFNSDSYPEIYIGNKIYDAETGTLLISNPNITNTASSYAHHNETPFGHSPSSLSSPCVANLVGDNKPDLILGNEIYEVLITNRNGLAGNSITLSRSITPPSGISVDGHPQVADFNLDGHLDVFVSKKDTTTSNVGCYVWDVHNNTVSNALIIPTNDGGKSIPLIADVDNDDILEMVIQCNAISGNKVKCFKYDTLSKSFTLMWEIYVDEDSYSNSMSVFDFNNDGNNDLLISDQTTVRIVNGSGHSHLTGNDTIPVYALTSLSFGECTVMQYPIVADVDADGSAELLVLGRFGAGHTYQAYLNVFKSTSLPWAPARKVWNQYMYNVTNVNEDLTIPQYLFNNATPFTDPQGVVRRPFNNFLQQATTIDQYGRPFYAVPDIAMDPSASSQMLGDSLVLTFSYCNLGDNMLSAPYPVTFFANTYGGDTLCTVMMTNDLLVDSCFQYVIHFSVSDLSNIQNLNSVIVAVNCAGNGIAQNGGLQPECDTTNNLTPIIFQPNTGFPDNVDSATCTFLPEGTEWGVHVDWSSNSIVSNLNSPLVGDLDNDGNPDVLCFSLNGQTSNTEHWGQGNLDNEMLVFDGVTKQLKATITMESPVSAYDAASYGLVRTSNGKGLIVTANYDYKLRAYDITSPTPSTPYWVSDVNYGADPEEFAVNVSFADFNGDGHPEVYVRNKVYNAETGKLLATVPTTNTGSSFAHYTHNTHRKLSAPMTADLSGNGLPELILGNEIYTVSLTNPNGTAGNTATLWMQTTPPAPVPVDGHAQVADFDMDGHLDVFISIRNTDMYSGTVYCYVWDVYNNTMSQPLSINTSFSGKSIPLIADIDNDGSMEMVIQCAVTNSNNKIQAYKYNAASRTFSMIWGMQPDEDSYSNSFTAFDFNLDGLLELIICDQSTLRIVNGSGKSHLTHNDTVPVYVLNSFPFSETTIMQYPVIADADADGSAEIVSVGSSQLNILKSTTQPWAPARKVWNQYMYNVTNINEDLTVPLHLFNNATPFTDPDNVVRRPFNNFLQQATSIDLYGRPFYAVPDVAVNNASTQIVGDTLLLSFSYCNLGDNTLNAPYPVMVFLNTYGGDTLCTALVNNSLPEDSCAQNEIRLPLSTLCNLPVVDSLIFAVNGNSLGIAQNGGLQPECDTTNNTTSVAIHIVPQTDTNYIVVHACDTLTWNGVTYDTSGVYIRTLANMYGCDSVVVMDLTVDPSSLTLFSDSVCQNSTYNGHGFSLSEDETAESGLNTFDRTLSNQFGCDSVIRLNLYVKPIVTPDFYANPDKAMLSENPVINFVNNTDIVELAQANYYWVWDFGDGASDTTSESENSHLYTNWGDYTVTLTLWADGCIDTASVTVIIEADLEFPNVITPNGDGINDVFVIKNLNPDRPNKLYISDRWGKVVWHKDNYQTYMKDEQIYNAESGFGMGNISDGVYYFSFYYEGVVRTIKFNGSITVIR